MSLTLFGIPPAPTIIQQLENPTVNHSDIVTASYGGSQYALEESIARRRGPRKRTSWIKDHGVFICEIVDQQPVGDTLWLCRYCDRQHQFSSFNALSTSSAQVHLRKRHRIFQGSESTAESVISTSSCDSSTDTVQRRSHQTTVRRPIPSSTKLAIEELTIGYIVNSNSSFNVFNDPFLRQILILMDPSIHEGVSWGRTAIRHRIHRIYNEKKEQLSTEFSRALSKIHLAFDLWTSPNRKAILGVSAHYISSEGKHEDRLLALREQFGAHTGANIASALTSIVRDWSLTSRLGVLVSDNATSNDVCSQRLFDDLRPDFQPSDVYDHRIRCYGHILNLVGRAFLYGEDFESFEQESQRMDETSQLDDALALWRRRGPVGKLHNVVRWVRSSPQRSEYFRTSINESLEENSFNLSTQSNPELQLISNNETRWNSTFMMIQRALDKKDHIEAFLQRNAEDPDPQKRIPVDDCLTSEDWRLLVELKDILQPVYFQTMLTQGWGKKGINGNVSEILVGMEYLLEKMEDWRAFFDDPADDILNSQTSQTSNRSRRRRLPEAIPESPTNTDTTHRFNCLNADSKRYFRLSVMNGWKKLDDYYRKLDTSSIYASAVILNPLYGIQWLRSQWQSAEQQLWLTTAKTNLRRYWERWYRQGSSASNTSPPIEISRPRTATTEPSEYEQWKLSRKLQDPRKEKSELDQYLQLPPIKEDDARDPIAWWISQQGAFPTVSRMAIDILAIPAMAATCERAFSSAGLTITSQRHSMHSETMEYVECTKNWLRAGSITLGGFNMDGGVLSRRP